MVRFSAHFIEIKNESNNPPYYFKNRYASTILDVKVEETSTKIFVYYEGWE